jgi:hypothetical protein
MKILFASPDATRTHSIGLLPLTCPSTSIGCSSYTQNGSDTCHLSQHYHLSFNSNVEGQVRGSRPIRVRFKKTGGENSREVSRPPRSRHQKREVRIAEVLQTCLQETGTGSLVPRAAGLLPPSTANCLFYFFKKLKEKKGRHLANTPSTRQVNSDTGEARRMQLAVFVLADFPAL